MKVCVVGAGHVGAVTAACLASLGHDVVAYDVDARAVAALRAGRPRFHEAGLPALLREVGRRCRFTTDPAEAVAGAAVALLCVPTPPQTHGAPDLSAVEDAALTVAAHATGPVVIAEKSTVPVGTGDRIAGVLALDAQVRAGREPIEVVANPEFLREGSAVADTLRPDRVVVGADSERGHAVMRRLYAPLLNSVPCAYVATDRRTAELAKHSCNAFLATKISFANAVARLCEQAGADVRALADVMGHDPRIGRAFLDAGLGYGGSCLPKDVAALAHTAAELGAPLPLLRAVQEINEQARRWPLERLQELLWNLAGKTVAVLGAAFKPGTDDLRDAPALALVEELRAEGADVRVHDPVALPGLAGRWPDVTLCVRVEQALAGAHAAVVCTEWDDYKALAPSRLAALLSYPVVVDARGVWPPQELAAAGLVTASVGCGSGRRPGAGLREPRGVAVA